MGDYWRSRVVELADKEKPAEGAEAVPEGEPLRDWQVDDGRAALGRS